ncbi:HlyD family secretion protein [Meinhardsimonia xiamenensis]|jgi:HlyD family secretion protein|uniref:HlyD family secretion protein n=1 Tax=Meinhardsimonia xiamenensis TaxID=990712 RepID=A0A1G8ZG71_9RHOB|nr:HlyD family efflux transporter periplasmic adaptor subunit [Meinhardsimonia xiamenensis]PRX37681.1 HlyD family secretion protein [Meinhardsimonia xiamenensis]SDK13604.1 HlyD family secretion protein [Meinhardsimonia xiamenensis]
MKMRTLIGATLGAAALAGLLWAAFRPQPVPVDLAEVTRGPMQITVGADGRTRIREVFEVAAPFTGRAERSPVRVGDPVVKGETVVAIVRPAAPPLLDARARLEAQAAVREAEAALAAAASRVRQAEEELDYARTEYERIVKLVERGVASTTQLENAHRILKLKEAALDTARSEEARARSALARARAALVDPEELAEEGGPCCEGCCLEIRSPADGVVLEVAQISARPVQMGEFLVSVGRPDDLEIVADLLSADAVRLPPDARASVERWGGAEALEARLRRIEPVARTKVSALGIEEQRVDAIFDILTPPEERPGLGHGFAVYLRIIEWEAEDVVQLPLSAVFREGGEWFAFTVREGRARRVRVELGRRNGEVAELLSGLSAGDVVIVHPSDRVVEGVEIVSRTSS